MMRDTGVSYWQLRGTSIFGNDGRNAQLGEAECAMSWEPHLDRTQTPAAP